jgi:hypothetical protein
VLPRGFAEEARAMLQQRRHLMAWQQQQHMILRLVSIPGCCVVCVSCKLRYYVGGWRRGRGRVEGLSMISAVAQTCWQLMAWLLQQHRTLWRVSIVGCCVCGCVCAICRHMYWEGWWMGLFGIACGVVWG